MNRPRRHRGLKWLGLAACAVFSIALGITLWHQPRVFRGGGLVVVECNGTASPSFADMASALNSPGTTRLTVRDAGGKERVVYLSGTRVLPATEAVLRVPLAVTLFIAGALTGYLFWRDRRIPPGRCQYCEYNLTGNVSGRCPECGTPVKREGKPA